MRRGRWLLAVVFLAMVVVPSASAAPRTFEPRFSTNDTGDITFAANTLLTCPAAAPQCAAAQAGTATPASQNNNNAYSMEYVRTDPAAPGSIFSTASAELSLPPGSTVLRAILYFGGDSTAGTGGAAPPDAGARNTVSWKVPGAATYAGLTASQLDFTTTDGNDFQGVVDVTDAVRAAGAGTYWVGNVQAGTGQDREAGWSLVVAYRDTAQPARNLSIFDGFQVVNSGNPNVPIPVSGFQTPATGPVRTRLGFVVYEGDRGSTGDGVRLNTTTLSDPSNPATNFFNSAISRDGAAVTTKNPDFVNQLGFDAPIVRADGVLPNGATSATIRLTTTGETYFPGVVTFATELSAPDVDVTKTVQDLNGGAVEAGDVLRYTISAANTGQDDATQTVLRDPIPTDTTFVPGSLSIDGVAGPPTASYDTTTDTAVFRVGSGADATSGGTLAAGGGAATATFDVTVGAVPSGTEIVNRANAAFVGRTLGTPLRADSAPVTVAVAAPNLTIAKLPAAFTATVGGSQVFTLRVTNTGDAASDGSQVTVTDAFAGAGGAFDQITSVSAPGWTCTPALPAATPATLSCQRVTPTALAAGAGYPDIVVTARTGGLPVDAITNTATVAGGGDPDVSDNAATAIGQTTARADLALTKEVDRGSALTGDLVTFTLAVTNQGPSPASAVQVADPLGPAFALVSVASSQGACAALPCSLGTLGSGASATVTVVARVTASGPAPLTATNSATVSSATTDPYPPNNTASADVTVTPTADLRIAKALSATPLVPGTPVDYTLSIANDGPADAPAVVLTDPVPSGFDVSGTTSTQGSCTVAGGVVRCALGTIANGASATVTVSGSANAGGAGRLLLNTATVVAATADPDTTDDQASASALVLPAGDVELTKTVDDVAPVPGAIVHFTLALINHGPTSAAGVEVTDTLPAGLEPVSASGCAITGATVTCPAGTIAAAATRTFVIDARVAPGAAGQTLTNVATATSTTPDPVPNNGADAATISVGPAATVPAPPSGAPTPPAPGPTTTTPGTPPSSGPTPVTDTPSTGPSGGSSDTTLTLTTAGGTPTIRPGHTFVVRARVRVGAHAARRVRVCLQPAAGLSVVHLPGGRLRDGRVCWQFARVPAHRTRVVAVRLRVASAARSRVLASVLRVQAANAAPRQARAAVRVVAAAARPGGVTG